MPWKTPHSRRKKMSHSVKYTALLLGFLIAAGSVQPATAFRGPTTGKYCSELVVNKGIIDVKKFKAEVNKCKADPTTYK
jgi:hypothetical protein